MRRDLVICLFLAVFTVIGFYPVSQLGFLYYDDYGIPGYIVDNPNVQAGITPASIHWAFTAMYAGNWHPLTWISHMVDCQLFGLNPAGHHLVNLAFHVANTLLVFLLCRRLTGAQWRSAMVAALFGLHPLHIQSVAWVSERKDLLCGFFFLLTLLAYTRYVEFIKAHGRSRLWYGITLLLFALALMSKPMAITLPIILLLMDYWPLARQQGPDQPVGMAGLVKIWRPLVVEKIPFLILCLASSIITVKAQGESVASLEHVSANWRVANALASCVAYLGKTIWPVHLAIFYPLVQVPLWQALACGSLLVLLTILFIRRRSTPALLTGWIWFLVMLIPVIGLVQVSVQAMADRYMYLPSIGLFITAVWWFVDLTNRSKFRHMLQVLPATIILVSCLLVTRWQLGFWHDSVTLFSHAIEVTGENALGSEYLGRIYEATGNLTEAARNYRVIMNKAPDVEEIHYRLGYVLNQLGNEREAQEQFSEVYRLNPTNTDAIQFLGGILTAQGKYAEADDFYKTALQAQPDNPVIKSTMALNDHFAELAKRLPALLEDVQAHPTVESYAQIAGFRGSQGNYQAAVDNYSAALKLQPDNVLLLNNLAWILSTCADKNVRDGNRAATLARHACELSKFNEAFFLGTLSAADAEAGKFDDAITNVQHACDLAAKKGETGLVRKDQELLILYRRHQPYREDERQHGFDQSSNRPLIKPRQIAGAAARIPPARRKIAGA